jgi:nucleoside-diphosphate-sugar epimerase
MKILVTGSRGFIGTHLVKALREQKQDVTEFDLELGNDITKCVDGDYDVIYSLAAFTLIQTRDNPQRAIDVNVKGIVNMLELARRCDAKIIFSSASSVYGIPRNDVVKETDTIQPVSIYGATKAAAEVLIETYHKLYDIDYLKR